MLIRAQKGTFKINHPGLLHTVSGSNLLSALLTTIKPRGFKSALKFPEWVSAMDDEMRVLYTNDTWDLVPRPVDAKCCWC